MNLKNTLFFLVLFFSITSLFASNEFADITFIVDTNGNILTSGTDSSNEFLLNTQTPEFTSKKGSIWTLNITTNTTYNTFIFETIFPEGAQLSYIKTTPTFRIDESEGKLTIIGTGEDKPITLIVQYEINENYQDTLETKIILIGIIGIILGIFFGYYLTNKKKEIQKITKSKINDLDTADHSILPQRQKQIIEILNEKGKITQKELEILMKIPKASISRNVKTLEIKKIIKKERVGNTNYISINI